MKPIHWPAEAIWQAVAPLLPDFTVEVLAQLDSTNSELMRRARAGRAEPVLLVAVQQTAGKGRLGRVWHSAGADQARGGADLTFSLGLPLAPLDWAGLSLAVGVSVAQSLHPDIGLKWPNDLWWQDRKLGGILIETLLVGTQRYAVIGVGINIAPRAASGLATAPVGLTEIAADLDAPQALGRLAAPLVAAVKAFETCGFAPFQARFQTLDLLHGRPITLSDGRCGSAQGVTAHGALLVQTATGMSEITSAEVSVRPLKHPDQASHLAAIVASPSADPGRLAPALLD